MRALRQETFKPLPIFFNIVCIIQGGDLAEWGISGKFYCGKRLRGDCGCCNGGCGPTTGCNCDACMQLDCKRYNLPKSFLVNPAGRVCQITARKSSFCGVFLDEKRFCKEGDACKPCKRI